jgi:hypothetical protein
MTARMLRSALLAATLTLMATATAGAAPHGSTPIDDVIDLTGTTFVGAGCTGGDLTDTSGTEHVTGEIRPDRVQLRADYRFVAVDSLTGETFRGAGSRYQMLRGADTLFHINLRLAGDNGSRIMLTGTIHLDASGQSGGLVHSLECIHAGG